MATFTFLHNRQFHSVALFWNDNILRGKYAAKTTFLVGGGVEGEGGELSVGETNRKLQKYCPM